MLTPQDVQNLKPAKDFFVGIDSDGCAFDSMEIKQKECFCPAFVNNFNLQPISKYARETWEFVNLYSRERGVNRFHAVIRAMDLLAQHPEVIRRGFAVPKVNGLRDWVKRESKLGNPALAAEVEKTGDKDLAMALSWSKDVNAAVEKIVRDAGPFPYCRESLEKLTKKADLLVVSQTPTEALEREWEEHGIKKFARAICGQEVGTKSEHLKLATDGKYDKAKVLMLGDAPGDYKAAKSVGALFFPILPGQEEVAWKILLDEGLDRFFEGTFAGKFADDMLERFFQLLPEKASWEK